MQLTAVDVEAAFLGYILERGVEGFVQWQIHAACFSDRQHRAIYGNASARADFAAATGAAYAGQSAADLPSVFDELEASLRRIRPRVLAGETVRAEALYPTVDGAPPLAGIDGLANLADPLPQGRTSLMTIHLFSSCPMGEDKRRCVADSFGKVHGQENLYVADASLLCTAPGVNPQGSIMAFARRNALHFLEGR